MGYSKDGASTGKVLRAGLGTEEALVSVGYYNVWEETKSGLKKKNVETCNLCQRLLINTLTF